MSRAPRIALLVVAVVGALATGGCHAGAPAPATSSGPAAAVPVGAGSADPLTGVEPRLDAIERRLDRDGAG